jgi:hypothetical protein
MKGNSSNKTSDGNLLRARDFSQKHFTFFEAELTFFSQKDLTFIYS